MVPYPWDFLRLLRLRGRAKRKENGAKSRTVVFLFMFLPCSFHSTPVTRSSSHLKLVNWHPHPFPLTKGEEKKGARFESVTLVLSPRAVLRINSVEASTIIFFLGFQRET